MRADVDRSNCVAAVSVLSGHGLTDKHACTTSHDLFAFCDAVAEFDLEAIRRMFLSFDFVGANGSWSGTGRLCWQRFQHAVSMLARTRLLVLVWCTASNFMALCIPDAVLPCIVLSIKDVDCFPQGCPPTFRCPRQSGWCNGSGRLSIARDGRSLYAGMRLGGDARAMGMLVHVRWGWPSAGGLHLYVRMCLVSLISVHSGIPQL